MFDGPTPLSGLVTATGGPPLVLLHGLGRNADDYQSVIPVLADIVLPGATGPVRLGDLRSPAALEFSASALARLDPEVFTPVIAGRWLDGYPHEELLTRVNRPVLLLQGDPSCGATLTDADAVLAAGNPCVTRRRFPGTSHLVRHERTGAVVEAITEFCRKLPPTGA